MTKKQFSTEEREAMQERARELAHGLGEGEVAVLAKIAAMDAADRALATRIHELVHKAAPQLTPKTWYGMPAYADRAGKVICFF